MNTTGNLLVEDCGVDNSVSEQYDQFIYTENALEALTRVSDSVRDEILFKSQQRAIQLVNKWTLEKIIKSALYFDYEGRLKESDIESKIPYYIELVKHRKITQNELKAKALNYIVDCQIVIGVRDWIIDDQTAKLHQRQKESWEKWNKFYQQQQIEEKAQREEQLKLDIEIFKKERKKQLEEEYKDLQVQLNKQQFLFGALLIQRQKNSTSFLMPNENNKKVTAYDIIKILSGNAFKSYKKQIKFKNNKIQILPYSERYRIGFYFRQQYKKPPLLDNANIIAAFINTAIKYTNNIELQQNWHACLDAINTSNIYEDEDSIQEKAASLFTYYGWAADYAEEFPRMENAFYIVDVRSGTRHYNIVNDKITLRFMAIEWQGRGIEAYEIITNSALEYDYKCNRLQALFKPLLWWRNGVKMGLTTEARLLCEARINEYINSLLEHNAFDGIPLEEHINGVEIDKSETGIVWAEPQQFSISMDDMEFLDYQYNIDAEYNKDNNADKGKKKAYEKYSRLIGDEWNTAELKAQGYTPQQIINYCKYKWIKEVPEKKNRNLKYYQRIFR